MEKHKTGKYNVGDRVTIKAGLVVGKIYGNNSFVETMLGHDGETHTIIEVNRNDYYLSDIDIWSWTDEMLDPTIDN